MNTRLALALISLAAIATMRVQAASVPRLSMHEVSFTATGTYANPYVEVTAEATLTEPDGHTTRMVPLFWDGAATWKMRFAPDKPGVWKWTLKSTDRGIDGQSGMFDCVASSRRGSIQPMIGAPRHFQYQNGERMWFMADTAWAYLTDSAEEKHDRAAAERYLSNRAAQGFNAIHVMLLNEAGWSNQGGPPWTDIAGEKINPGYFREADQRIAFANANGVVTGIVVAWGNKGRKEPYSWGRFPGVEARKRFARYAAARFSAYDTYFVVSGEWHGEIRSRPAPAGEVLQEFVALGDALRAADPHRRMMGIHPMTAHGSTREFNGPAKWMDFADYQQNYRDLHERALASRAVAKPVVNSEYGYYLRANNPAGVVDKPHSYSVDDMRHATWDIVMAGAYFVTGFGSTYMGGLRHPTTFLPDDPKNTPVVREIGNVKRILESLEYWRLEPHDELLASGAPRTADRATQVEVGDRHVTRTQAPATTYWCLADPGRTYLVYVRGTTLPVRVTIAPGGTMKATRHDPRDAAAENVPVTINSGNATLMPPDERDWVFVLRSAN